MGEVEDGLGCGLVWVLLVGRGFVLVGGFAGLYGVLFGSWCVDEPHIRLGLKVNQD